MRPVPVAALIVLFACGGCSIMLDENSGVYSAQPGKYDFLDCPGIQQRTKAFAAREAELSGLMERANQGAGGTVVSALVYRDELNMVRADRRALQKASDEKRCAPDIQPAQQPVGAQTSGARSLY
jgi:hypothetical protein